MGGSDMTLVLMSQAQQLNIWDEARSGKPRIKMFSMSQKLQSCQTIFLVPNKNLKIDVSQCENFIIFN